MAALFVSRRSMLGVWIGVITAWSAAPSLAQGLVETIEPAGPGFVLSPSPDINRPPITFLPMRARPKLPRPLQSWKALRDRGVVRQAYDYSCGSAALATLLAAAGDPASEPEILDLVFSGLDEAARLRTMAEGLTLLDLQRAAHTRGHRAEGYRVEPAVLSSLTRPVIVYIEPFGYRHFAVLRGLKGDRVFLADPARGNVRMPIWRFLDMWQDETGRGVLFVVGGVDAASVLALDPDAEFRPELLGARQLLRLREPRILPIDAPTRSLGFE